MEIGLGVLAAAVGTLALVRSTAGTTLVGVLLLVQAVGYAAAPLNSAAAIRSDLPAELRRRRRFMVQRWGRPGRRSGLVLAAGVMALSAFVVFAAPVGGPDLANLPGDVLHDARPADPSSTPTATPTRARPSRGKSVGNSPSAVVAVPTSRPTQAPTTRPTQAPTTHPTQFPTSHPTQAPTTHPTATQPTQAPTTHPTPTQPTQTPTTHPTATQPTSHPTATQPTRAPTTHPTATRPPRAPTSHPSTSPPRLGLALVAPA